MRHLVALGILVSPCATFDSGPTVPGGGPPPRPEVPLPTVPNIGEPATNAPPEERGRLNLSWLVQLHWWAIVGQLIIIVAAWVWSGIGLPLAALAMVLVLEAAGNVLLGAVARRIHVSDGLVGLVMLLDAAVLTVVLDLTGGATNPFSTLYLVNVALGAVLLPPRWAWALLVASLGAFGSLFVHEHFTSVAHHVILGMDAEQLLQAHLRGSWGSLALAAIFIGYFVRRIAGALAQRERELREVRAQGERREKLASLATLAAGAAHELSTPLATIAVVAKELQRALTDHPSAEVHTDLTLIRDQLARCREILDRMSANAGERAGEPLARVRVGDWVASALDGFGARERIQLEVAPEAQAAAITGPPRALADVLRGLLKNAVQASAGASDVVLRITVEGGRVGAAVLDAGRGMPAEILARAGEPFFTTKVPGEGMGLGLFLTRTLAEQLGGEFRITSRPGSGTEARIVLPATTAGERSHP
jgi:two-component system, sensor histidine kinase RegB